ncbi:zinc finger MYM-type protein 1-like [Oratosquilla oratoria]|uniref:zinc finger MYM-type protein 1-like n=1 Tax=Oratosquilla oratoria TaxID=337810 RepID=UPI003F75D4A4
MLNDGNFRALLRYRIRAGDDTLKRHIEEHKGNASYLSPDIQNALLSAAGSLVQDAVVENIKKYKFWSIIADETMDRQKREQLAIAIRYVLPGDSGKWHCYEEPVAILDLYENIEPASESEKSPTGEAIGGVLVHKMKNLGLDLCSCVGQGYDGDSIMVVAFYSASTRRNKNMDIE